MRSPGVPRNILQTKCDEEPSNKKDGMPYPTTSTTKVEPDGPTRREVLKQLALAVTAAGTASFNLEAARVVHEITNNTKIQTGTYTPVSLSAQQFRAISRLAAVIIPPGGEGGSGTDAGAPEFIDQLCSENEQLATIFRDGLTWLDDVMRERTSNVFVETTEPEQIELLDDLVEVERGRGPTDLRAGVGFFAWARRLTVDAYYTSPVGIADVGFRGNQVLTAYSTPPDAIAFVNNIADDLGL